MIAPPLDLSGLARHAAREAELVAAELDAEGIGAATAARARQIAAALDVIAHRLEGAGALAQGNG